MKAALHGDDNVVTGFADHELARMADGCGAGEVWDIGVWNADRLGERVGKVAQPGAENNSDAGLHGRLADDERGCLFRLGENIHEKISLCEQREL
jgi:hypothetical protein